MNILLVSYIFYPEPIAMSGIVCDIAQELGREHSVTVLTSKPCRPLGYQFHERLTREEWKFKRILLDSYTHPQTSFLGRARESDSFGRGVSNYILTHKNEINVVYGCIPPLWGQYRVVRTCKRLGIPIVLHVEDIFPEPFKSRLPAPIGSLLYQLFLPMDKYIISNCSKAIVIGPKLKQYMVGTRKVDFKKVEYVYNWQDETQFVLSNDSKKNSKFTFMYTGSLSTAANLIYILEAFIEANPSNSKLVFAGSGRLKEQLKKISQTSDVDVEFLRAPKEDISRIQSKADVLILPLQPQVALRAFPSKFPAYLFSQKPVLACVEEMSDVADCVMQSKCGWIVDPLDKPTLIESFRKIPQINPSMLEEMGRNGFIYSQKNLTRRVCLDKVCNIILNAKTEK